MHAAVLTNLLKSALQMVYPPKCHLCRRFTVNEPPDLTALDFGGETVPNLKILTAYTENICRHCLKNFSVLPKNACPVCGCVPQNGVCVNCQNHKQQYVDRCMGLLFYNNAIGPAIKSFKYSGDLYLGRFLSLCMLAGLAIFAQNDIEYHIVTPVPLHPKKLKARKFNQNERLMRYWPGFNYNEIKCLAKAAFNFNVMARSKNTRAQAGLDMEARAQNVADAFFVPPDINLNGLNVLITDDIVTTGATVENCAKALKAKGAARVDVICVARTMPHLNPNHLLEI